MRKLPNGNRGDEATQFCEHGVGDEAEKDARRGLSGENGTGGTVGGVGQAD